MPLRFIKPLFLVSLFLGSQLFTGLSQSRLENSSEQFKYQNRGNRNEGIKKSSPSGNYADYSPIHLPYSGSNGSGNLADSQIREIFHYLHTSRLVSARADYDEEVSRLPDIIKLRFYLPKPAQLNTPLPQSYTIKNLSVRQLHTDKNDYDLEEFYLMDHIQLEKSLNVGGYNEIEIPTMNIMRHLDWIKMNKLDALLDLVGVGNYTYRVVIPLMVYYSQCPSVVKGYTFTFYRNFSPVYLKTDPPSARVYSIGKELNYYQPPDPDIEVYEKSNLLKVKWDSSKAKEGWYWLSVTAKAGFNQAYGEKVVFYHKPIIK